MFDRCFLYAALTSALTILFHISATSQQTEDRAKLLKEIDSINKELKLKEKALLSVSPEDRAPYREFLKQPNTGLIRLLPVGLFGDLLRDTLSGALYSFARSAYGPDNGGPDLIFTPDKPIAPESPKGYRFIVARAGFIVTLGDIPIENVGLDHQGIKFLTTYQPQTSLNGERAAIQFSREGIIENGYDYLHTIRALVNNTYALRSIKIGTSDVLVAFRVVRQDSDGSVMILWKNLKRFPIPVYTKPKERMAK